MHHIWRVHSMTMMIVRSEELSHENDPRYVICRKDTGEIADDAQGYGYRSKEKARAAWSYMNRASETPSQYRAARTKARKWLDEHTAFAASLEAASRMETEAEGPALDARAVKRMLEADGHIRGADCMPLRFTAADLLLVWKGARCAHGGDAGC